MRKSARERGSFDGEDTWVVTGAGRNLNDGNNGGVFRFEGNCIVLRTKNGLMHERRLFRAMLMISVGELSEAG